ncbi:sugar ABC transporter permease [Vallitalea longa]|uniref:Sugar ABC transporter permease n=1 Tax=Vallitalea longa TaxID=2936439 RepID=A0A9W6DGF2_9FIRM|nr:sugar ABC transporter permease [Vallitalea longa]
MKKNGSIKTDIKRMPGYLFIGFWCLFTFVVICWIICASLSTTPEIFSDRLLKTGVHFENYYNALVTHNVYKYFINSIIYTVTACFGVIIIGAPCAYALARFVFRGKKALQNLFVAALGIPQIMIIMPLFSLITNMNLKDSRIILIILYICINVPFTIFFMIPFFRNLPSSLEESAAIDGCSQLKTFWKIMLPLAQPGIITVTIFNFITIWNEYFMSLIFANKTDLRPVAVGLYSMIQSMRYTGDWAGMFAAVVIVFLPTFILYLFLSEKIIAGITGGSVKG